MLIKKYLRVSPHALRAYRLFASCLVRQWEAVEKNTLVFRHTMRILIDSSASGDRGSEKC